MTSAEPGTPPNQPATSLAERIGLHRPELVAWALYDWANSAFVTTILAAVFPIFYVRVAAAGLPPGRATVYYAVATAVGMATISLMAPPLGALADYAGAKKKLLAAFMGLGVLCTAGLATIDRGEWLLASVLFVLANIGVSGSFAFYDSLLPHVAREDEVDRVSTAGYALGYLGGGLLLAVQLLAIGHPGWFGLRDEASASRAAFASVAVWWLVFSLPLLVRVREPRPCRLPGETGGAPLRASFARLARTFHELRRHRQAALLLLAFLLYNDGINTIIRMAASYGTEIGIGSEALIGSILLVQFTGIPFAFLFGALASRVGTKPAIFVGLVAYLGITVQGYFMRTAGDFLFLALLVGMVQGGCQALSRSLFATLIPRHKSSEFFAFFGVLDKFAGVIGPTLFATVAASLGSSRPAILGLMAFFLVGGGLLSLVDVDEGRRAAREAEALAREVEAPR